MHEASVRDQVRRLSRFGWTDNDVALRTGLPRTTVRDIRRSETLPLCPRCRRRAPPTCWTHDDYAFLLGLYLGDGYASRDGRTARLRLSLDSRYPTVIAEARGVLERVFSGNRVGEVKADRGSTTVLSIYNSHIPCLLPQMGPGRKHMRRIELEPWQADLVRRAPYEFLKGSIWSDGCTFINRTGPYYYLSVDFCNYSADIRALFAQTCEAVGLAYRANADRIRINKRVSVSQLIDAIGTKR